MWKVIYSITWLALSQTTVAVEPNGPISIGEKTVLVYKNVAGDAERQFVLRIARFKPDIFLEWESREHQGTVHLFRKAVARAEGFTLNALFDVGVDTQGKNVMTKWLSRQHYERLAAGEETKLKLNRISTPFKPLGRTSHTVRVNKQEIEVEGLEVEDGRGGRWVFLMDPDNPMVLEYTSKHYREFLEAVSTDPGNYLRWIKRLPPIR